MKLLGWLFLIVVILIVGFLMASSETQEKVINNVPDIIGNILEKLQKVNENTTTQINNINYEKVGKPVRMENVSYDCLVDDDCNSISSCNLNCECLNSECWKQKI